MAKNLNAKIALIDRAIGTNLASALSQAPSTFLAGIGEINEKIFNNKVDIEYSKLVSHDEKGNLVYDYDAIASELIHSRSDYHIAALEKIIKSMADVNGNLDQNKYHDFMMNLYYKIISSSEYYEMFSSHVPIFGFTYDFKNEQWHTNEFNIQRLFGFADAYNVISALLGCQIDDEKVLFETPLYDENGQSLKDIFGNTLKLEHRWEWWVGTYGLGSFIGGEAGIYSRIVAYNEEGEACEFPAVAPYSNNIFQSIINYESLAVNEMPTKIYIYDKNNYGLPLIEQDTRDYALFGDHYWNLAVKKNEGEFSQGDLALEVEYEIKDDATRTAFIEAAQENSNILIRYENGSDYVTIYWQPKEEKD
jgi:hypothetical protein